MFPILRALGEWFRATNTPHLIIGGIAVSAHGTPRTTRDIDSVVFIDEDGLNAFIESGRPFGFVPRIPNLPDFARSTRVLLFVHEAAGIPIDLSLGALPFELESLARGVSRSIGDVEVRVPSIEDLIIMKAIASRPIDLADIDGLLNMHPNLDRRRIREWVRDFADVLESTEILDNLDRLLAVKRPPKRRPKRL
jgi:hypothetical protein